MREGVPVAEAACDIDADAVIKDQRVVQCGSDALDPPCLVDQMGIAECDHARRLVPDQIGNGFQRVALRKNGKAKRPDLAGLTSQNMFVDGRDPGAHARPTISEQTCGSGGGG